MMNDTSQPGYWANKPQAPLPNSTIVLVLGIISIVGCCCYGVTGFIISIIAIVLANKDQAKYFASPGIYTQSSYNNLKAGKICAVISLILSSLYIIVIIIAIAMFGIGVLTDPEATREILQQYQ